MYFKNSRQSLVAYCMHIREFKQICPKKIVFSYSLCQAYIQTENTHYLFWIHYCKCVECSGIFEMWLRHEQDTLGHAIQVLKCLTSSYICMKQWWLMGSIPPNLSACLCHVWYSHEFYTCDVWSRYKLEAS